MPEITKKTALFRHMGMKMEYVTKKILDGLKYCYERRYKLFYYSGIEFIYRKFIPVKKKNKEDQTLPTGFLWAIGIYVAFFGIASQRYENKVDLLENRHSTFLTTVSAGAPFVGDKLIEIENSKCPEKPEILNPISILRSMFWPERQYPEFKGLFVRTVDDWKNKLSGANLSEANLSEVNLKKVDLSNANLFKITLNNTNLSGANLSGANLNEANMNGAYLANADMQGAILTGVSLIKAEMAEADLSDANLFGADLSYAFMREAKLARVHLEHAILLRTNFFKADLHNAYLFAANLNNAFMTKANLSEANLQGANLNNASLAKANLQGANLAEADLTKAIGIEYKQLKTVRCLHNTMGINDDLLSRLKKEKPSLFLSPQNQKRER